MNKYVPILLSVFIICFFCLKGISQINKNDAFTSLIEIDPRQYITVSYIKNTTKGKFDTIYNWESRKNVPNQKVNLIDIDGEIKISFDRNNLALNKDFEGTFSLEAEISGNNGTRNIEVSPYSEIGVQRIPIGIKSEPPTEITVKLLNILRELREVDSIYYFMSQDLIKQIDYTDQLKTEFINKVHLLEEKIANNSSSLADLRMDARDLDSFVVRNLNYTSVFTFPKNSTRSVITRKLNTLKLSVMKYFSDFEKSDRERIKLLLNYVTTKTDIVVDYLNSFDAAGEDALKAVLSLLGKDIVNYRSLKSGLLSRQKKLSTINLNSFQGTKQQLDSIVESNIEPIVESIFYLAELSKFKGSRLEKVIKDIQLSYNDTIHIEPFSEVSTIRIKEKNNLINGIDKHGDEIATIISYEAARLIYKKLVFATIDLGRSGAKSGEVLNIYVTWILDSKRDSLYNSPRLPVGKYYLRETGWKSEVTDMFALVKRVNEDNVDQTKVSPSNFKGSGGAVLMLTYHKEDKGLSISEINEGQNHIYKVRKRNKLLNVIEPSFGLNVSYLDFSTDKDVEIGAGLQLGLFRNKVFLGYGVNLHMLSPEKQSPTYFYIGFSFAKLTDLFKTSDIVTSYQ